MNLSTEPQSIRKFLLDRSFDDAAIVHRAQERKPVLMKPEQIDALKKDAHDDGYAAGKEAARNAQNESLLAILKSVESNMAAIIDRCDELARQQQQQSRLLSLAIARKILPEFTTRHGLQEIEAVIAAAIKDMAREPRLVVRIHDSHFEAVNEHVQRISEQSAYSGKVIVLADAEMINGDCRVEWADGGVERKAQMTWSAIENTILNS